MTGCKDKPSKVESDHNVLITKFKLNWHTSKQQERNEMFNLENKQGQTRFKHETSNNKYISSLFDDETKDLEVSARRFIRRLDKLIQLSFKKIRITNKPDKKTDQLYESWRKLQGQDDDKSKEDLESVEEERREKIAEKFKKIETESNKYNCDDGDFNSRKLWNLMKHLFPKHRDPPTAMLDDDGNL